MIKYLLLVLFILSLLKVDAQNFSNREQKKSSTEAVYYQDLLNFNSDKPGMTKVDVYIQVPYKNLQFVKSNVGFTAKYSVTASVFDSSKSKLIVEKTWNETINVIDYTSATSKDNYNLSKRSFELTPGTYSVRTMLEDKDSKQEAVGENIFVVRDLNQKISFSDVLLISKTEVKSGKNEIIPNVSRNFASSTSRISFYCEVYLNDSVETRKSFEYSILNSDNKVIKKEVEDLNLKPGTNQLLYTFKEFPFDLGTYSINVAIVDSNNTVTNSISKAFYSHWKGLPLIVKDIDKAIAQTVYIASPDELSYMKAGETTSDKTKRFLEFWKKKDPSPNNDENEIFDEYFRRISFANDNFSNYTEGWRSDRGMVYTILGAPNNIDRHPFEYDSKPYEVWEYYDLNRSFVFLDQTGFGDYRLVTPLTGDLYRYRY